MYFLNQLTSYTERFLFENLSVKLKHQKVTSHLYFTMFLEKFLFQLSIIKENIQPQIQDLSLKNRQNMTEVQKTKQTYSKTSKKLCCQSNAVTWYLTQTNSRLLFLGNKEDLVCWTWQGSPEDIFLKGYFTYKDHQCL